MMNVIGARWVKTRKVHQCYGCNEFIQKGEKSYIHILAGYDAIITDYYCMACSLMSQSHYRELQRECSENDGLDDGFIKDYYGDELIEVKQNMVHEGLMKPTLPKVN